MSGFFIAIILANYITGHSSLTIMYKVHENIFSISENI
ncbi:MAG: hypothetical protein RLZZ420_591 [Bacteroidota bacterium]|jgi:hypothetical protein